MSGTVPRRPVPDIGLDFYTAEDGSVTVTVYSGPDEARALVRTATGLPYLTAAYEWAVNNYGTRGDGWEHEYERAPRRVA